MYELLSSAWGDATFSVAQVTGHLLKKPFSKFEAVFFM
jgi:hypothetical protein